MMVCRFASPQPPSHHHLGLWSLLKTIHEMKDLGMKAPPPRPSKKGASRQGNRKGLSQDLRMKHHGCHIQDVCELCKRLCNHASVLLSECLSISPSSSSINPFSLFLRTLSFTVVLKRCTTIVIQRVSSIKLHVAYCLFCFRSHSLRKE